MYFLQCCEHLISILQREVNNKSGVKTSNFWRSNFFSLKCKIDQEIERGLRG